MGSGGPSGEYWMGIWLRRGSHLETMAFVGPFIWACIILLTAAVLIIVAIMWWRVRRGRWDRRSCSDSSSSAACSSTSPPELTIDTETVTSTPSMPPPTPTIQQTMQPTGPTIQQAMIPTMPESETLDWETDDLISVPSPPPDEHPQRAV